MHVFFLTNKLFFMVFGALKKIHQKIKVLEKKKKKEK